VLPLIWRANGVYDTYRVASAFLQVILLIRIAVDSLFLICIRITITILVCLILIRLSSFSSAMINYVNNDLTIVIELSTGILRAAWAKPLLTGSLINSYQYLLDKAESNGCCRFWHLDLRTSIWPAATFMQWFTDTFVSLATQRLGGPVFMACWVTAKHRPHVEHMLTTTMQERGADVQFYTQFFDKEPAARAWLLAKKALHPSGQKAA
jgi:hypothetical protein